MTSQSATLYLFDIDGTLLLSGGAGSAALDRVFAARYGLNDAMAQISCAGKTEPMIIAEVFESHLRRQPEAGEITAIIEEYIPHLRATLAEPRHFRLMPAVIEVLDFLAAQSEVYLGLATGNARDGARAKLERAGLWQRFALGGFLGGFGDDSAERAELVERAIERAHARCMIELRRERIVVVGDTPNDIRAAQTCGVRSVAVATGSASRAVLEEHDADVVFDTLAELPGWHHAEFAG